MSVVGKRKSADPNSGRMPPMVVSRHAVDPATAPPRAAPRRPGRRKRVERSADAEQDAEQGQAQGDGGDREPRNATVSRPLTPVSMTGQTEPTTAKEPGATRLWQDLMMYLPHTTPLPDDPLVLELLSFARRRDLPQSWKFQLVGGLPAAGALCALLVYLCGPTSPSPCDLCAGLSGRGTTRTTSPGELPFPGCITLPETASSALKEFFGGPTACCNRFCQQPVGTGKETCSVSSRFSLSSSDPGEAPAAAGSATKEEGVVPPQQKDADAQEDAASPDAVSDSDTSMALSPAAVTNSQGYQTALPARVIGRPKMLGAKAVRREVAIYKPRESVVPEDREAEGERQSTTAEGGTGTRRSRPLLDKQQKAQPRSASKQSAVSKSSALDGTSPPRASRLRKENKSSSTSPGNGSRADWDPLGAQAQNKTGTASSLSLMMADWEIAPGRIRVRDGREGIVENGTTFQVIEVPPGGNLHWTAEESRMRLCSVAQGVIRVRLPEKEFPIGPNGAVIHVTTIGDHGF
ncbi:hypothetical protein VTG60DRAFT_6319 [Thermothelomyces hinnuleus]